MRGGLAERPVGATLELAARRVPRVAYTLPRAVDLTRRARAATRPCASRATARSSSTCRPRTRHRGRSPTSSTTSPSRPRGTGARHLGPPGRTLVALPAARSGGGSCRAASDCTSRSPPRGTFDVDGAARPRSTTASSITSLLTEDRLEAVEDAVPRERLRDRRSPSRGAPPRVPARRGGARPRGPSPRRPRPSDARDRVRGQPASAGMFVETTGTPAAIASSGGQREALRVERREQEDVARVIPERHDVRRKRVAVDVREEQTPLGLRRRQRARAVEEDVAPLAAQACDGAERDRDALQRRLERPDDADDRHLVRRRAPGVGRREVGRGDRLRQDVVRTGIPRGENRLEMGGHEELRNGLAIGLVDLAEAVERVRVRGLVALAEVEDPRGAARAYRRNDRREPRRDVDVRLGKRRGVERGHLDHGDADPQPWRGARRASRA